MTSFNSLHFPSLLQTLLGCCCGYVKSNNMTLLSGVKHRCRSVCLQRCSTILRHWNLLLPSVCFCFSHAKQQHRIMKITSLPQYQGFYLSHLHVFQSSVSKFSKVRWMKFCRRHWIYKFVCITRVYSVADENEAAPGNPGWHPEQTSTSRSSLCFTCPNAPWTSYHV